MDSFTIIRNTVTYIEKHLHGRVTTDELARAVGYSQTHLRDIFARHTGIPLGRYITRRQMSSAAFDILYEDMTLTEIAGRYGYDAYDTFTRAFARVAGCTPSRFRVLRPPVERRAIVGGIFGVFIAGANSSAGERTEKMLTDRNHKHDSHSTILYGVPKVHYGAYSGCTPYPIALKACANYLGEDIDYADAMVGSGAGFRLTWNTAEWDGGNVDVSFTFDEEGPAVRVYEQGARSIGRSCEVLAHTPDSTKGQFIDFIKKHLDDGVPVIACGMVGPPEAGVVTGYRDDGQVMLGWSVFQNDPEFASQLMYDESGYYVTSRWWENGVDTLIALGETSGAKLSPREAAALAVEVMTPRMSGAFAKGVLAYSEIIRSIGDDIEFTKAAKNCAEMSDEMIWGWRLMCVGDVADCLSDGRGRAAVYFARHKAEDARFGEVADCFSTVYNKAQGIFNVLGGFMRGPKQIKALGVRENRQRICALLREAEAADRRALDLLRELAD